MPMPTKRSSAPEAPVALFFRYNRPGLFWAAIILVLSSIAPPPLRIPDFFDLFSPDKVAHFFFYAVLTVLFVVGFMKMSPSTAIGKSPLLHAFWISCVYGGLIELHQGYILSHRTADPADFVANCIGAVIGLVVVKTKSHEIIMRLFRFRKKG
ncbi:MAG: hypothetical protein RLZZ630_1725 [Bacteroidota bacterium]